MEYTGEIIDLSYAARITAIFVAGNKMYTSNCDHQDCYEEFCEDNNIDSGLDWSGDFNVTQEKAIKITNSLFEDESEDIYGFDIFEYDFDKYYLRNTGGNSRLLVSEMKARFFLSKI